MSEIERWDPIIGAKIGPPPLPASFVPRVRLSELFETGDDDTRRLTLVSAPPGYGKTTATRDWLASTRRRAAWLTLETADNDPMRFARYLTAAVAPVRPSCELSLADPSMPGFASPARWSEELVRQIASDDSPFALVLDDYHVVASRAVHALANDLLAHLPPFVRFVILTREDPPLPIGRLRAHGQLLELRADDLRCTAAEAHAFMSRETNLGLGDDSVEALRQRTEGWFAALQLAALSLRGRPNAEQQVREFGGSHRYVIEYLTEQVLARQDAATRSFLARTAIADRFTADLCDVLTGRADSAAVLTHLQRANLLLVPLDDRGEWFRYHQLFSEVLRDQLGGPERARLHASAARWFSQRGHGHDAVRHALATGDVGEAERCIARHAPAALEAGEAESVIEWLDALPSSIDAANPDLRVYRGWACWSTYRTGEADAAASGVEDGAVEAEAYGRLLCLRALLSDLHARPDAEALALRALELLRAPTYFRFMALVALGSIQWGRGMLEAGANSLVEAVRLARVTRRRIPARYGAYLLAGALDVLGRREEALRLCRELASEDGELALPPSPYLDAALGLVLHEGGDDAEASPLLERALALAGRTGFAFTGRALLALCESRLQHEGVDRALAAIATVRRTIGDRASLMAMPQLDAFEALIRLEDGDLASARAWADGQAVEPDVRWVGPVLAIFRNTLVIRILLAQGRVAEAGRLVAETKAVAVGCGSVLDRITLEIIRAEVQELTSQREHAQESLGEAVRLAAPGGYVRRFVEDGRRVKHLLPTVRSIDNRFVDSVLEAIEKTESPGQRPSGLWRGPDGELVELLTTRELEVLREIAAGQPNAGIARTLGVSVGTVKWHVVNLLGKLGATSRTQAVARGRQLGLL